MKQIIKRLTGVLALAFMASACGSSSPASPAPTAVPTTAGLHIGVDLSTCFLLGPVAVSIDGQLVGSVTAGDAGVTKQVAIGGHEVSGIGLTRDALHSSTWAPQVVTVPAAGVNWLLYCTVNRGYSEARQ